MSAVMFAVEPAKRGGGLFNDSHRRIAEMIRYDDLSDRVQAPEDSRAALTS